jgi:uncharacterized protein HemX
LIALIAAACLGGAATAQTQNSGTGNTGKPTQGQSTANSGEQNAAAMQNNSNAQNTATARTAKDRKAQPAKGGKVDCNEAHTDGHATTPDHKRADCDTNTRLKR